MANRRGADTREAGREGRGRYGEVGRAYGKRPGTTTSTMGQRQWGRRSGREIVSAWDPDERSWLEAFRTAIKSKHADAVKDIVIYGSKARGDWHEDSDIDVLLIVANDAAEQRETLENLAYDLSVTADALPLLTTKTEAEWNGEAGTAFHRAVERDGVSVL